MVTSEFSKMPEYMTVLTAVILAVFLILAVAGNILSLVILHQVPRPRNANSIFIAFLCVTSLIYAVVGLPMEIARFVHGKWSFGEGTACSVFAYVKYFNVGIMATTIGLIAVNRLMLVAFRQMYQRLYRPCIVHLQLLAIVLYSFVSLLPTLMGRWGQFGFDSDLQTCTIVPADGRSSKKALFVVGFLVPSLVICVCYSGIVLVVIMSRRRLSRHSSVRPSQASSQTKLWSDTERRVAVLGLVLFIVFLLCYVPSTIVKLLDSNNENPCLHVLGYITMYSSLWINPVLYLCLNEQYRQICYRIFARKRTCSARVTSSRSQSTCTGTVMYSTTGNRLSPLTAHPELAEGDECRDAELYRPASLDPGAANESDKQNSTKQTMNGASNSCHQTIAPFHQHIDPSSSLER